MKHLFLDPEHTWRRLLHEYQTYGSLVIAVDFDNTLYDYHHQGLDCREIIALMRELKKIGCYLILWTASEDERFIYDFCAQHAIPFDAMNENPPFFTGTSRKIYYNELLDDRAGLAESFHRLQRLVDHVANA